MCDRVRLIVETSAIKVEVHTLGEVATIRIPRTIDAARLGNEIMGRVGTAQLECARRLWADDSYSRYFGQFEQGIVISCAPFD